MMTFRRVLGEFTYAHVRFAHYVYNTFTSPVEAFAKYTNHISVILGFTVSLFH